MWLRLVTVSRNSAAVWLLICLSGVGPTIFRILNRRDADSTRSTHLLAGRRLVRDILEGPWRHVTSGGEHKSLITTGFIHLLIRRSLVRAQVEEPKS